MTSGVRYRSVGHALWSRVDMSNPDGCWPWTGSTKKAGYGQLQWQYKQLIAHRVAYEQLVGPIPAGLTIDHLCENEPCCNPYHMEPVTQGENTRRMLAKKTHCKRGHPLSDENVRRRIIAGYEVRRCRACDREAYHARKRTEVAS